MAVLSYKLHIKDTNNSNKIYECSCYTTVAEAKPVSNNGTAIAGETWEIKNNNIVCYLGLVPKSSTYTTYKTPLIVKKGGTEYYVQTQTVNKYKVTISATSNQTITFECEGVPTTVTTASKTVYVNAGAHYTCTLTASEGYTKGTISGADEEGYVTSNMTISASPATKNSYTVTVTVPTGATITVGDTTFSKSDTTTLNYQDRVVISCAPTNSAQYSVTDLTVRGAAFTSGNTYTMPADDIDVTCTATIRKYTITKQEGVGTTLTVTANGNPVASGTTLNYGTVITHSATAKDGYESATSNAGGI